MTEAICWTLAIIAAILSLAYGIHLRDDCTRDGGVYVRGFMTYECISR